MTVINHMGHEYFIHDGVKIIVADERASAISSLINYHR